MIEPQKRGQRPLYKRNTSTGEMQMFCPGCSEEISPADVESYLHCPFCNTVLLQDDDFDDFMLSNVVKAWVAKNNHDLKG